MSYEKLREDAAKVLNRWTASNQSPQAQNRLINDRERL